MSNSNLLGMCAYSQMIFGSKLTHEQKRDALVGRKIHLRKYFNPWECIHSQDSFSRSDGLPYGEGSTLKSNPYNPSIVSHF